MKMNHDTSCVEPDTKKIKVSSLQLIKDGSIGKTMEMDDSKDHKDIDKMAQISIDLETHNKNTKTENNEDCPDEESDEGGDLFEFPPDDNVTDMLKEVEYTGAFPTTTERYFTAYYKLDVQTTADDICILLHSNRVCMLSLAPSHAVLRDKKKITKVDFKVSEKLDRTMNKVSGKSKHGAQPLQADSKICVIHCSNGETYTIKCCMNGKLVEVNERLVKNPEYLLQPPHKGGYLAIILPNIKLLDKMKESLLTQGQYDLATLDRSNMIKKELCAP